MGMGKGSGEYVQAGTHDAAATHAKSGGDLATDQSDVMLTRSCKENEFTREGCLFKVIKKWMDE